jgi:uncharacterized membrane protein YhaH (DUF805 family)
VTREQGGESDNVTHVDALPLLVLLFGLHARVTRRAYLVAGVALLVLKVGVETALVRSFTGRTWSLAGYLIPSLALRQDAVGAAPQALHVLLALFTLPFLWIGLSMSVRRAVDARFSPWLGTLFVVPLLNYVVIAVLCFAPSRKAASAAGTPLTTAPRPEVSPGPRAALAGLLTTMAIGVTMMVLLTFGLGSYGAALFVVTPFAMGAASASVYNREAPRSLRATVGIACAGVLLTGGAALLFGVEGVLCLLMAAPLAMTLASFGALIGWAIAIRVRHAPPAMLALVAPLTAFGEMAQGPPPVHVVTTSIEVDAPPERVWQNVIGFSELEEPPDWFFRLGIAYPKRARIEGEGVGAVRHCEFSTGAFVEPVTTWMPPRRLAFDVVGQPPPMAEWSPYPIHPRHLDGYVRSIGGQFDLLPLPGGRTHLEGTTRYVLSMSPAIYWTPYTDAIIHAVHWRVLRHVRGLSEKGS